MTRPAAAQDSYAQFHSLSGRLGEQVVRFVSKPGLAGWQAIAPAAALLAEHAGAQPGQRILYLGCGHGAAAAAIAASQPEAHLWLMDVNIIALQAAEQTLQANRLENAQVWPGIDPPPGLACDLALVELPKGRGLARRWLVQAGQALRPGGRLLLAGAKDLGIQPMLQEAGEWFGPGAVLDYKKGSRVAEFIRPPQAPAGAGWWSQPGVAPGAWLEFSVSLGGEPVRLATLPGVFAADHLDEGTALLLEAARLRPGERALDLGCGSGVIGIHAARSGAGWVDLSDANLLAVAAAQENLRRLGIVQAEALASDAFSALGGRRYDYILSNPPFHAGQSVDYQMAEAFIGQGWQALAPGGRLALVANRFIRYEKLMTPRFRRLRVLAEDAKFRVLEGEK